MCFGSSDKIRYFIPQLRIEVFNFIGHRPFGLNRFIGIHGIIRESFVTIDLFNLGKVEFEFEEFVGIAMFAQTVKIERFTRWGIGHRRPYVITVRLLSHKGKEFIHDAVLESQRASYLCDTLTIKPSHLFHLFF